MLFKKNKDIIVQTNEIPVDVLKNFLLTFPHNLPKYFKDIPANFFDEQKRPIRAKKTVKSCSGFINLFKRCIVFTSPYDIELFIEKDGIKGSVGAHPWNRYIQPHANWQFIDYVKSPYAFVLKFMPFFLIKCPYNLIVTNPWWHMNSFETVPGIINCKEPLELNIFIPIKKNQTHLFIPQGTPLGYIHVETDQQLNLIYKNKGYKHSDFLGLHYSFSNLKRKVVNNIIKKP
jgi:hypothetical protein|tara:strand:+ start:64 stop:756 length:693 start_codon:yes stop_codon:yes gene_type:complete